MIMSCQMCKESQIVCSFAGLPRVFDHLPDPEAGQHAPAGSRSGAEVLVSNSHAVQSTIQSRLLHKKVCDLDKTLLTFVLFMEFPHVCVKNMHF